MGQFMLCKLNIVFIPLCNFKLNVLTTAILCYGLLTIKTCTDTSNEAETIQCTASVAHTAGYFTQSSEDNDNIRT